MLIGSLSAMNVHTGAAIIQLKGNRSIHADVGVRLPQCHLKHLAFDRFFFYGACSVRFFIPIYIYVVVIMIHMRSLLYKNQVALTHCHPRVEKGGGWRRGGGGGGGGRRGGGGGG